MITSQSLKGRLLTRTLSFVTPIKVSKFEKSGQSIEYCTSEFHYMHNGVEKTFLVRNPENSMYGPDYKFDMNATDKEKENPKNATGVQMPIPLTSFRTIDHSEWPFNDDELIPNFAKKCKNRTKATKPEGRFRYIIDLMHKKVVDSGLEMLNTERKAKGSTKMPGVSMNSFRAAKADDNPDWYNVVKRPYSYRMMKDSKTEIDFGKALSFYASLVTVGKKEKMNVKTPFFVGDEQCNPLDFKGLKGNVKAGLTFRSFGVHMERIPMVRRSNPTWYRPRGRQ